MSPLGTPLEISLEGDGAFSELQGEQWQGGMIQSVAVLENGTHSGRPSVALKIRCDDGTYVVAQTTWALFGNSARAIEARHGPPLGP